LKSHKNKILSVKTPPETSFPCPRFGVLAKIGVLSDDDVRSELLFIVTNISATAKRMDLKTEA